MVPLYYAPPDQVWLELVKNNRADFSSELTPHKPCKEQNRENQHNDNRKIISLLLEKLKYQQ